MRRMKTRQAMSEAILLTICLAILLALLVAITSCTPSDQPISPTSTVVVPTFMPLETSTAAPTPTSTPWTCLTQPGRVETGEFDEFTPSQQFRVYLPPCYDQKTDERYPVLYLLHGQTYTDDQWIRLGAVQAVDQLIMSGEALPFIIVFPDDRYWNLQAGPGFGARLIENVIPYIDSTYRTLADRDHRAIGGMSRGAGWSLRLGLAHPDLFSIIGLHSLAVLQKDSTKIPDWVRAIPTDEHPTLFMDIGDNDQELVMARNVEAMFTKYNLPHEWHLYSGDHTEKYWSAHVEEYMRWYAEQWDHP